MIKELFLKFPYNHNIKFHPDFLIKKQILLQIFRVALFLFIIPILY